MRFTPKFTITAKTARCLMRIEAAKQAVQDLPIMPSVLATLRETGRLFSSHYSTMIEGSKEKLSFWAQRRICCTRWINGLRKADSSSLRSSE